MFTNLIKLRPLIAISEQMGAGKKALTDALLRLPDGIFERPKSLTTRSRRESEGGGESVSRDWFDEVLSAGGLINRDDLHGNLYGVAATTFQDIHKRKKIPIIELHTENLQSFRAAGFLVLHVRLIAESDDFGEPEVELADHRAEARETSPNDMESGGYTLVLKRRDYGPSQMIEAVMVWLRASDLLSGVAPHVISTACNSLLDNIAAYDAVAPDFTDERRVTTRFFHAVTQEFWRKTFAQMNAQGRYLEVGPGQGWLRSIGWPERVPYEGIDVSEEMRNRNPSRDKIEISPANALCYSNASLDGVLGSLVDPFLLPNFLLEIVRVLKPNGSFTGTSPAGEWARKIRQHGSTNETMFVLSSGQSVKVFSYCYSGEELSKLFHAVGLCRLEMTSVYASTKDPGLPPAISAAFVAGKPRRPLPVVHMWTVRKGIEKVSPS